VTLATRPERFVVEKPPPEPDYQRYRVEPGTAFGLSDVDPGETEHYRGKKRCPPEARGAARAQRGAAGEALRREQAGGPDRLAGDGPWRGRSPGDTLRATYKQGLVPPSRSSPTPTARRRPRSARRKTDTRS
jgi:hypothetical protein